MGYKIRSQGCRRIYTTEYSGAKINSKRINTLRYKFNYRLAFRYSSQIQWPRLFSSRIPGVPRVIVPPELKKKDFVNKQKNLKHEAILYLFN